MTLGRQIRLFGIYPLACALYQSAIYLRIYLHPGNAGMGLILNPRIFFAFLFGASETKFEMFCWASALWLFCIAIGFLFGMGRYLLILYPISELLLSIPMMYWIFGSLFGWIGHVALGTRDLLLFGGMFLVFSVLPMILSVILAVRFARQLRAS